MLSDERIREMAENVVEPVHPVRASWRGKWLRTNEGARKVRATEVDRVVSMLRRHLLAAEAQPDDRLTRAVGLLRPLAELWCNSLDARSGGDNAPIYELNHHAITRGDVRRAKDFLAEIGANPPPSGTAHPMTPNKTG